MTVRWREFPPESSPAIAMTPNSLKRKISKLRITAPVTASYGQALIARGIWSGKEVWYSSQKEHWMGWLSEYRGPEYYGGKNWRGRTGEFVYNHINCPPMVLWLAEASGVPRKDILAAKRSALSGGQNRGSHCALIRKAIPWSAIE